jgi:hypothetical protein
MALPRQVNFCPIFRQYVFFNNKEAKASERSENERRYFLPPVWAIVCD